MKLAWPPFGFNIIQAGCQNFTDLAPNYVPVHVLTALKLATDKILDDVPKYVSKHSLHPNASHISIFKRSGACTKLKV